MKWRVLITPRSSFSPQTSGNRREIPDTRRVVRQREATRLQAVCGWTPPPPSACHAEGRGFESHQPLWRSPANAGFSCTGLDRARRSSQNVVPKAVSCCGVRPRGERSIDLTNYRMSRISAVSASLLPFHRSSVVESAERVRRPLPGGRGALSRSRPLPPQHAGRDPGHRPRPSARHRSRRRSAGAALGALPASRSPRVERRGLARHPVVPRHPRRLPRHRAVDVRELPGRHTPRSVPSGQRAGATPSAARGPTAG
jgi:hypothetical protein